MTNTKAKVIIGLAGAILVLVVVIFATRDGGIPNGRYETAYPAMILTFPAFVVDGNNFTVMSMGLGMTYKYTYDKKTGTITLDMGYVGMSSYTYKNGSIWYAGAEYKKVK